MSIVPTYISSPCAIRWRRYTVITVLLAAFTLVSLLSHAQALSKLSTSFLRARDVTRATLPTGQRVPCPEPLSRAAHCNAVKVIPASSKDLPPSFVNNLSPLWDATTATDVGGCCAFSDAYRFIYVRIPKSASTTLLSGFLRPAVCPPDESGFREPGYMPHNRYSANCTPDKFVPTWEPGGFTDCAPCASIPRWKWLRYFVFTAVRDPLTRAVSSWAFCKNASGATFAEFCINPDKGVWCSGKGPHLNDAPDVHWMAQTANFCGVRGCIVDFVARAETLAADLDVVVESINSHRLLEYPPLPLFSAMKVRREHGRKTNVSAQDLYSLPENSHCKSAVKSWYAEDFEILRY